jgi:acid phosphatase
MRRLILVACILFSASAFARPRTSPAGMQEVKHIFVVVLENGDAQRALQQPFLASLASRGALLRNYHAVTTSSQSNYIALVAGSTYGVADDAPVTLDVRHLGDLLDAGNISWNVYADDYPGDCFLGAFAADGDNGWYVRAHVPFLNFANVQSSARCSRVLPGWTFGDAALPQFTMYIPDNADGGEYQGIAESDAWLRSRFAPLLNDSGTLLIVVSANENDAWCSLTGAGIRPGSVSDVWYDHYSLLRTIEEIFRTGTLHQMDDPATIIGDVWKK